MKVLERVAYVKQKESEAIASIVVDSAFEKAVSAMASCQGKIITTGIGKAGNIASNFAATLRATVTPAFFLHPSDALHGDLGAIESNDCLFAFSTSGKSTEVLSAVEMAKNLGVSTVIGVTSHVDSKLRELSDLILNMGVIEEPCPLGLTPSASSVVMHSICDALTLSLMELKGVTAEEFGQRHHGGYLGQKSNQQVESDLSRLPR